MRDNVQTAVIAVFIALIGFSYALATNNSGNSDTTERAARAGIYFKPGGSLDLEFANPLCADGSGERDLGDAVFGSALTRQVRARGGISPYTFTAGSLVSSLKLAANGLLSGVLAGTPGVDSSLYRFECTIKDSLNEGSTKTGVLRLTFSNSTQFRFAVSQLSDGVQYASYSDTVAVINGTAPVTFAATNVVLNGAPLAGLSEIGLGLSSDGVVFGVPLKGGPLSFTCTATAKNGTKAAGRDGTGTSQVISIMLLGNTVLNSLLVTSSMTIKAGFGSGKDSISYSGLINYGGARLRDLNGEVLQLRVGEFASPLATFNTSGKAIDAKGTPETISGTLSTSRALKYKFSKGTVVLSSLTAGKKTVVLPVEFRIGEVLVASEVLKFSVKDGSGTKRTLTYKASASTDADGSFMFTSITGADDKANTGDAWKASFIARPNPDFKLELTRANISIGTAYVDRFQLTGGKGKNNKKLPVVSAFALSLKNGKGSFATGVLPTLGETGTGIPTALSTFSSIAPKTQYHFAVNMSFAEIGSQLDGSTAIYPSKGKWTSKIPK